MHDTEMRHTADRFAIVQPPLSLQFLGVGSSISQGAKLNIRCMILWFVGFQGHGMMSIG